MPLSIGDVTNVTILNDRNSLNLLALFGLFLMNAENFAKMSAPTSKDSLFSGLRWGYLPQREEKAEACRWKGWFRSQQVFINCLILICDRTWEEPAPVPETPRFWWSLFWVCRCRGGKEGWCQGRGLWAPLASYGRRRRMEVRKQNFNVWFTFNNWIKQLMVPNSCGSGHRSVHLVAVSSNNQPPFKAARASLGSQ